MQEKDYKEVIEKQQTQIKSLQNKIEKLEIELKHVENDFFVTSQENNSTTEKYLEILSSMDDIIKTRTRELQQSHNRLEHKSNELQVMLDASPTIIFYKDLHGRFMRVNKAFCDFVKLNFMEIIGKTNEEVGFLADEDAVSKEQRAFSGEKVIGSNEKIKIKDSVKQIVIDRIPYYGVQNEIIGLVGLAIDETEIRKYEAANYALTLAANTDPLTNLLNRRGMYEKLNYEMIRAERSNNIFCLAMADIDHFKKFNDEFGHDCGDFVLSEVSKIFTNFFRKQDVVSRWGGEEFLMLLPETKIDGATHVLEIIRQKIESHEFLFEGKVFNNVSATFGVCQCDFKMGLEYCIKIADDALYKGKKTGRNKVVAGK